MNMTNLSWRIFA